MNGGWMTTVIKRFSTRCCCFCLKQDSIKICKYQIKLHQIPNNEKKQTSDYGQLAAALLCGGCHRAVCPLSQGTFRFLYGAGLPLGELHADRGLFQET